ncbi:hypothetical protein CAEBREN_13593 [Caenorhabditis brenneri]|uniref:Zinc finger PHD-type domain-containing protein n=1 Tax=Caenorhabditis brenneri TaxID=135651 RepID=G0NBM0_CAEBE|nr:hypothetical protein CAEBREN_13593 [Caenorhabditis brenneri]
MEGMLGASSSSLPSVPNCPKLPLYARLDADDDVHVEGLPNGFLAAFNPDANPRYAVPNDNVLCACNLPRNEFMITCNGCKTEQHRMCVGVEAHDEHYYCNQCRHSFRTLECIQWDKFWDQQLQSEFELDILDVTKPISIGNWTKNFHSSHAIKLFSPKKLEKTFDRVMKTAMHNDLIHIEKRLRLAFFAKLKMDDFPEILQEFEAIGNVILFKNGAIAMFSAEGKRTLGKKIPNPRNRQATAAPVHDQNWFQSMMNTIGGPFASQNANQPDDDFPFPNFNDLSTFTFIRDRSNSRDMTNEDSRDSSQAPSISGRKRTHEPEEGEQLKAKIKQQEEVPVKVPPNCSNYCDLFYSMRDFLGALNSKHPTIRRCRDQIGRTIVEKKDALRKKDCDVHELIYFFRNIHQMSTKKNDFRSEDIEVIEEGSEISLTHCLCELVKIIKNYERFGKEITDIRKTIEKELPTLTNRVIYASQVPGMLILIDNAIRSID